MVEIGDAEDARDAGFRCPPARIASEREGAGGSAVVRPVSRRNLVTPGEHSRDADRIFVRLRPAVSKEEGVDVSGCDLGELCAQSRAHLSGHERVGIGEFCGLLVNCASYALIAMPDVHAHQLTIEVDETLSFRRPEVDSLRAFDRNRFHRGLGRPFEDCVPGEEIDDLLARHGFTNYSHETMMLPRSRLLDNVRRLGKKSREARAGISFGPLTWGSATLHPRLYASTCSAGSLNAALLQNDSINHVSWQSGAKTEQRFYFVRRLDFKGCVRSRWCLVKPDASGLADRMRHMIFRSLSQTYSNCVRHTISRSGRDSLKWQIASLLLRPNLNG